MLRTKHGLLAAFAACTWLGACSDEAPSEVGADSAPVEAPQAQVAGATGDVPCDVAAIVSQHCASCHGATPSFGAPFPLTNAAQFASHASEADRRIKLNGPGRMPPTSTAAMPAADITKLSAWLTGGAKAASNGCAVKAGTTTAAKPGNKGGSGKAHAEPIEYDDPDLKCYKFLAFAGAGRKDSPYSVPTTPDLYVNFVHRAPWTGTQYIRSFKSVIDNKQVLHHWLFFRNLRAQSEGASRSSGTHPNDEMLFGWAPGGDDMYFDPDVAMEAPSGTFTLEAHYNNSTGRASPDRSGVEICVTPKRPDKVAGLSWVGSDAISGTSARGTCRPSTGQVAHIIATQPHMHKKGIRMKVTHSKGLGQSEVVHDEPFDFNYQRMYLEDITVSPGDTLNTTCTYSGPSRFGAGTNDEMCYYFSIHWPAGALKSSGGLGSLLHGPNTCM
jgi:mono/diheme cytochrome c family protein